MCSKPKKLCNLIEGDRFVFCNSYLPGVFVVRRFVEDFTDVQRVDVAGNELWLVPSSRLVRKVRVFY